MTSPECDGSLADDSGGMSPFKLLKKNVGFPGSASGKELPANAGGVKRLGLHPWVRKVPWRGHGNPLQYSCLENPTERSLVSYSL